MRFAEQRVIGNAGLGLFHGADCYDFYRHWCSNAHLIHNIHTRPSDLIPHSQLEAKVNSIRQGKELRIIYAGRMVSMKQPDHWIRVMKTLKDRGVRFSARWLGDGQLFAKTKQAIHDLHIDDCVELTGFVADKQRVIESLRAADCLVFCNREGESPRVLIESLNQGTPIVGYENEYAKDLTVSGGGCLSTNGDPDALASELFGLSVDRSRFASLVREAANVGKRFTDEAVFEHRAGLIKRMPIWSSVGSARAQFTGTSADLGHE
jgi:glycosyltransferase involved in cell wall biosynthesis